MTMPMSIAVPPPPVRAVPTRGAGGYRRRPRDLSPLVWASGALRAIRGAPAPPMVYACIRQLLICVGVGAPMVCMPRPPTLGRRHAAHALTERARRARAEPRLPRALAYVCMRPDTQQPCTRQGSRRLRPASHYRYKQAHGAPPHMHHRTCSYKSCPSRAGVHESPTGCGRPPPLPIRAGRPPPPPSRRPLGSKRCVSFDAPRSGGAQRFVRGVSVSRG